ncbi:MAG: FecR domain-containing protein [Dysgonamonadaceae bacterium]|jgi:ferric-dicitrate binding protein FerR (iron transport regulator)|nr:FecR domain-containing protein [Dysgonamonadaceae bacterium]
MEKDFSSLASKILSGEATEQERETLRQMLHESEDDALLFNEIKEYWDAKVVTDRNMQASVDEKIHSRIKGSVAQSRRNNFINSFWRAAAIFLLLLSCGTIYYYNAYPSHTYMYATQGAISDYILGDSTKVKLNKYSSITFTSSFGKNNRRVDLSGEAYFEVTKDAAKKFTVRTQDTETTVFGTEFNVLSDKKSKQVTVTLSKGSVGFEAYKCQTLLHPGEEIVYDVVSGDYNKQITDLQFNTAWTTGRYLYSDITFGEFIRKLEHIYHIRIDIDYPDIENKVITALFLVERPIGEILSALKDELKFKYRETDEAGIVIEKSK